MTGSMTRVLMLVVASCLYLLVPGLTMLLGRYQDSFTPSWQVVRWWSGARPHLPLLGRGHAAGEVEGGPLDQLQHSPLLAIPVHNLKSNLENIFFNIEVHYLKF